MDTTVSIGARKGGEAVMQVKTGKHKQGVEPNEPSTEKRRKLNQVPVEAVGVDTTINMSSGPSLDSPKRSQRRPRNFSRAAQDSVTKACLKQLGVFKIMFRARSRLLTENREPSNRPISHATHIPYNSAQRYARND